MDDAEVRKFVERLMEEERRGLLVDLTQTLIASAVAVEVYEIARKRRLPRSLAAQMALCVLQYLLWGGPSDGDVGAP